MAVQKKPDYDALEENLVGARIPGLFVCREFAFQCRGQRIEISEMRLRNPPIRQFRRQGERLLLWLPETAFNRGRVAAVIALEKHIGRFELVEELGRGAQGTVLLARDTRLDRLVALKTLNRERGSSQSADRVRMLLDEARIVSRLQHPNIVTLFDAGEDGGVPYLVFEYVEGQPLNRLIADDARPPLPQIVDIVIGVLRGMASAHDKQVLHRDIKPANIMLTERGVPRIMDFGIACHASGEKIADNVLYGTPSYMAPEYVTTQSYVPASDVYAVGVLLYELLTGVPPVSGPNVYEVLHRIANTPFDPPSRKNPEIDERLDLIVMKALEKQPESRFPSADKMAQALADYLAPAANGAAVGESAGTLEFLLRRIRYRSDFPVLGNTIGAINRITASDREPTTILCNAILKDVALAAKLLKVVNATTYGQFGGSISTVSRAVAILGFDTVRSIATSLLLFENLQNKAQAAALKEETAATYFSAVLAGELVRSLNMRGAEEAFLCAMFHRLGRLLVTFYLHEDRQAIDGLAQLRGWEEGRAAREILGLSYEDIGMGIARQWNFPDEIVASMRSLDREPMSPAAFNADRLRVVAELSNRLCDVVRSGAENERGAKLEALVQQFGRAIGVNERNLDAVIAGAVKSFARDAQILGPNVTKSRVIERAQNWGKSDTVEAAARSADTTASMIAETQLLDAPAVALFNGAGQPVNDNRQAVLSAGVQDVTNTLVGEFALNDVLRIILETMFRGIGFQRILLFVRDPQRGALYPRLGFGANIDTILRSGIAVPLDAGRDVFFAAMGKGADICIEDINAEKIREYVPRWYRDGIKAHGMVLFPIRVNEQPVALIYADADTPERLRFKPEELNLLKTLRNQAVSAIRQKS